MGFQCLGCAIDGFFGTCARDNCAMPLIALGSCYDSCDSDGFFGYFDCIKGLVAMSLLIFYQCLEPHLKDGSCKDDFADCTGMFAED